MKILAIADYFDLLNGCGGSDDENFSGAKGAEVAGVVKKIYKSGMVKVDFGNWAGVVEIHKENLVLRIDTTRE